MIKECQNILEERLKLYKKHKAEVVTTLQVKVEVVTDIITILVAILASVVFVWITKKSVKWWRSLGDKDEFNEELVAASVVGFVIFSCLLLILDVSAFLRIWDIPELLINPEYAAFQNIVEQLGSLK